MAEIKLTKNDLRLQQNRLAQLQKYLPTLQLKKAMLQAEVNEARLEIIHAEEEYAKIRTFTDSYSALLSEKMSIEPTHVLKVKEVRKRHENIAGVEVPYFEEVIFEELPYSLFETPVWFDSVVGGLKTLTIAWAKIKIAKEKKEALERELREVSIRVNLFEKRLIPQALSNIKKIKVFLGDQQLAAVSQAKVAKRKIEEKKKMLKEAIPSCELM